MDLLKVSLVDVDSVYNEEVKNTEFNEFLINCGDTS